MSIVDDRGRIAGRVNLIDAIAAAVVVVLIPAAYGAYLLFRTPAAKLTAVKPAKIYAGGTTRVEVEGHDLRPFMRVSFNDVQGKSFLIGSTTSAQIDLPDLPAGTYDVVLYDYSQEMDRLSKAFTVLPITPLPTIDVQLSGVFTNVTPALREQLTAGRQLSVSETAKAEILTVGTPTAAQLRIRAGGTTLPLPTDQQEIPATIRVPCAVTPNPDGSAGCVVRGPQGAIPVVPDAVLSLPGPSAWILFQIRAVHLASDPAMTRATVRFVVPAEVLAQMKAGDSDGATGGGVGLHDAALVSLGASRTVSAAEAGADAPSGGNLRIVEATLRVPLDPSSGQWSYRGRAFKVGAVFIFDTARYVARGLITGMTPPAPQGAERR